MENLATLHSEFYIFGDFNLQFDKRTAVTIMFDDTLTPFYLKQHVTFSTHIHGHWLYLVITRSTYDNIQMLTVSDGLSDHHTVIVDVFQNTNTFKSQCVFKADILKSYFIGDPKGHLSDFTISCTQGFT